MPKIQASLGAVRRSRPSIASEMLLVAQPIKLAPHPGTMPTRAHRVDPTRNVVDRLHVLAAIADQGADRADRRRKGRKRDDKYDQSYGQPLHRWSPPSDLLRIT